MPTDWLFYWMTRPLGLVLTGLAVAISFAISFGIWRLILGRAHAEVGYAPLVAGYACALAGLAIACFTFSYLDFSSRVADGLLPEARRWSTVGGWSVSMAVLFLALVLPLISLLGVPLSAVLLKRRRLNYFTITVAVVVLWLSLAALGWARPSNEWDSTHRLESLVTWLKELLPGVLLIALPFLLSIHRASRAYRHAGT